MSNKWETVRLRDTKPTFPGCLDLDVTDGNFVSATFKCKEGLFRIRKSDYSTVVEKRVFPMKKVFKVTSSKNNDSFDREIENEGLAREYMAAMENAGFEVKMEEAEVLADSADCLTNLLDKL